MTENRTITLVVAEDQTTVREALAVMLDLAPDVAVVATATNGAEALDAARRHRPDVVLMDLNMPVMDGVTATGRIHRSEPDTTILVLTTFDDDESILAALHAGASGYLTKDADRDTILHAVRLAASGQTVRAPEVQQRLLALASRSTPPPAEDFGLTARERDVRADRRGAAQPAGRRAVGDQRGHGEDAHQQPVRHGRFPLPRRRRAPPTPPGGRGAVGS